MRRPGLETEIVDRSAYERTVERFRQARVRLPTFAELEDPARIPAAELEALAGVDPDSPDPRNLLRVHWYNARDRRARRDVPEHLVLPQELTGVPAPIVVILGECFPMIRAHKVLAAYGCLVPRIVTGQFDPTRHRAVWPSTGNYCRGGVAISRILGCRGVAVLPEGMSRERFEWLERWVVEPGDIVRTPGTESNVKEIYDRCAELDRVPENVIFNQFCEFGNHLVHFRCTGEALARLLERLRARTPDFEAAGFVAATGSAGTLGAGDRLKELCGSRTVAVEALECPTLLYNGYGEHNIQGIGDKHVPLIHNVMATDIVTAVSDASTDALNVLFNTETGRRYLVRRRGVSEEVVKRLGVLGLSGIANVLACVKVARYLELGEGAALLTVATDGAAMYASELEKTVRERFGGRFDEIAAAEVFGQHLAGVGTDHLLELTRRERRRIFQLGYFTWVEQQGIGLEEFDARARGGFWKELRDLVPAWDERIRELNERSGTAGAP